MDEKLEDILGMVLKNPEVIDMMLPPLVNKYKKPVYAVLKEFVTIMKDYSNADEYFEITALIKKKRFDSLVKVGFNENQAMSLILQSDRQTDNAIAKNISNVSKAVTNKE